MQDQFFRKYSGALLFTAFPHQKVEIDDNKLKSQLIQTQSMFGRYYTVYQQNTPPQNDMDGWWHCVKSDPIYIDKLRAKQRYRINRGLKLNSCHIASISDEININELTDLLYESFSDYPRVYKPTSNLRQYANTIINQCNDNNYDVWLVYNKGQGKLVGIGVCRLENEVVVLQVVKVRPSYLKDEINAALAFSICEYYLNEKSYKYITDGERNIRHKSNYQDFLISVLGFRRIYCKLHVVYHPLINPIIKILYPFRKVLEKIENCNRVCYNISCVLKQEEIARKS